MSFHEISIAVRAENRASTTFRSIALDVTNLGTACGFLNDQQAKMVSIAFTVVRVFQSTKAILTTLTVAQTAQNTATVASAGVQTTLAISTTGAMTAQAVQNTVVQTGIVAQAAQAIRLGISSIAHGVYAAATWVANTAQTALNISYGTFLALTGVGIAVIIAAAAAMAYFASTMNKATVSVQSFNSASAETPTRTRAIQRAGEMAPMSSSNSATGYSSEASRYRRGIE
jgi:hypothetical protein